MTDHVGGGPRAVKRPPSAAERGDAAERRAKMVAEVERWIATRRERRGEWLEPAEIGASPDRPWLIQRSLLDAVVWACRERVGAGERGARLLLPVLIVDALLCDSPVGASWLSAERMAALLRCDERTVRRARDLIAAEGVMQRRQRPGLTDLHWPIVDGWQPSPTRRRGWMRPAIQPVDILWISMRHPGPLCTPPRTAGVRGSLYRSPSEGERAPGGALSPL
jgi:hypothetical protein